MDEQRVAILIPAYEPDDRLVALVKELSDLENKIIVVDDGSGKDYKHIFDEVSKYAIVLHHEENKGKGVALKTGIRYCSKQKFLGVVTADSDGQHAVDDIVTIKNKVLEDSQKIILGVRNLRGGGIPGKSKFGNELTRFLFSKLYGVNISDTQTGLRGIPINANVEKLLSLGGDRYEYEMNMLIYAQRLGYSLIEEPITTIYYDGNAATHFRPIKDGLQIYSVVFQNMPKFMLISMLSFCVDYVLFALLQYFVVSNVVYSTVIARLISASCNFLLNRKVVFKNSGKKYTFLNYIKLAILILILNSLFIFCLVDICGLNALIAKLIVEIVLYIVSFSIQNKWAHTK